MLLEQRSTPVRLQQRGLQRGRGAFALVLAGSPSAFSLQLLPPLL